MIPFPFFIPKDKLTDTLVPTIHKDISCDIVRVPFKTSQHVIENNLYFGLDLTCNNKKKHK